MNRSRCYILTALLLNVSILFYFVILQHRDLSSQIVAKPDLQVWKPTLSVILREYENFENNLERAVELLTSLSNEIEVIVIGDTAPYPPVSYNINSNVKILSLEPRLGQPLFKSRPENQIRSNYVLFLPDSTYFSNYKDIYQAIEYLSESKKYNTLAIPISKQTITCQNLQFSVKQWTLAYSNSEQRTSCDIVLGDHGILTKTENILNFSHPFTRPISLSYYIQNYLTKSKVYIYEAMHLMSIKELFPEPHDRWKHKKYEDMRRTEMYKLLGIKLVKYGETRQEWFGCSKDTARCFDTVVHDMPEYLYQGRWTPPCCLKAIKETVLHVFNILSQCGARYWLEGGSLLGAARNGNIIPWDYDVDIGIYKDDLYMCKQFELMSKRSFIDDDGFLWEKAIEGDFYRVQYSETNRLHVDIFPFYSRNGTMTKNTWIKGHKQDTEFPEHYLKPLTTIQFVGINAPAPNNIKKFLEFKFGSGVVENPKYPNLQDAFS